MAGYPLKEEMAVLEKHKYEVRYLGQGTKNPAPMYWVKPPGKPGSCITRYQVIALADELETKTKLKIVRRNRKVAKEEAASVPRKGAETIKRQRDKSPSRQTKPAKKRTRSRGESRKKK